ncbi:MAG: V-type ATP synthase subunit I [Chlamydiales bacterium]|nr:V-type ATP synthase subunit I [Chlamydiales bacterium]
MRRCVKKYAFIGLMSERDAFFEEAQKTGFIEFIPASQTKNIRMPKELEVYAQALKILRHQDECEQELSGDAKILAERVVELKHTLAALEDEEHSVNAEIGRVHIFGDFDLAQIKYSNVNRHIQFFTRKQSKRNLNGDLPDELIYIGTEFDLDYFVSIAKETMQIADMIEMHIERPLGVLQERLKVIKQEHKRFHAELKSLAAFKEVIEASFIDKLNLHNLTFAQSETTSELEEMLFVAKCWMPDIKLAAAHNLMRNFSVHCEPLPIEKDERVPTYLDNKGFSRIGEDLVQIYDVPSAEDKDPSPWVYWAFILFFSIIVADAGYGMLYFALAFFLRHKFKNLKGSGRRFLNLVMSIAIGCVAWGVFTASYFGMHLRPDNPISHYSVIGYLTRAKAEYHIEQKDDVYKFWVDKYPLLTEASSGEQFINDAKENKEGQLLFPINEEFADNILLELALLIGTIHICLSLLRYGLRSWANFGWVAFMIGAYLFLPSMLNATSMINFLGLVSKATATAFGLQLLSVGISFAIIIAFIQLRLKGLGEIANVIQIFADTLSYLRLYALGLAGMMMAATFNGIARDAGLFAGILILVAGHALNITMGAIGGIIHGLRLNFLEWYHYSFDGGGRFFKPLKLLRR